jgi:hypothetical protein
MEYNTDELFGTSNIENGKYLIFHEFRRNRNMYDFSGKNQKIGEIILLMCIDIIKSYNYKNNESDRIIENYQDFYYKNINNNDLFDYIMNDNNINIIVPILYVKTITNEYIDLFDSKITNNIIDILNDKLFKILLKYQNTFSSKTTNELIKFFKINLIDCLILSFKYKKSFSYMVRLKT